MSFIHREFTGFIKDGLRGARYVFRQATRSRASDDPLLRGATEIAGIADAVLSAAAQTSRALLGREAPPEEVLWSNATRLAFVDDKQFDGLFIETQYRLAESLVARRGARNVFISVQDIIAAAATLRRRHPDILADARSSVRGGPSAAIVRFCAATAVVLIEHRPIRTLDLPEPRDRHCDLLAASPNSYSFLSIALTTAILATRTPSDAVAHAAALHSASAVVEARFPRLSQCVAGAEPVEALAAELTSVLPFLP